jgi:sodium/hydrogen antiporter
VAPLPPAALWFVPLLFCGIRPLAVEMGLLGSPTTRVHRVLLSWFGIRGIGSLYYLTYALQQGIAPALGQQLAAFTLSTVAVSVVVHGLSVTPLMQWYREWLARRKRGVRPWRRKRSDTERRQDENKTCRPGQSHRTQAE